MKKWQKILIAILSAGALLCLLFALLTKFILIPKATDLVIEKTISNIVPDEYLSKELIETVKREDKVFVEEVIAGYAFDKDARNTIKQYIDNNDYTGLKDYAIQNLSPEQMEEALLIAEKYKEFLPSEGQEMLEVYLKNRR